MNYDMNHVSYFMESDVSAGFHAPHFNINIFAKISTFLVL